MTVNELSEKNGFRAVVLTDGDREICGGYVGDLLSWVMGRAKADCAWITIMSNLNIVAVASLADVACVILAEGVMPDDGVADAAAGRGINIISADMPAFEAAALISGML